MSALHMPAIHIWVEIINPTTTIMLISYTSYTKKGELSATENMYTNTRMPPPHENLHNWEKNGLRQSAP